MTVNRIDLLRHVDHLIRPPAWFYEQLEAAIELSAEGRDDEMTELDSRRQRVGEVIGDWELEEFVRVAPLPPPKEEEWEGCNPGDTF